MRLEEYGAAIAEVRKRKEAVYFERNQVVAALARCFPSGVAVTAIEGWHAEWHHCVYIDLPTGQVSWHYHDSHSHLFEGWPAYLKPWDGHTSDEKYNRLARLQGSDQQQEIEWLRTVLDRMMGETVKFATALQRESSVQSIKDAADAFLNSPEVEVWRKRQKEESC